MTTMKLIAILIAIESGGNQNAINMKENACGVLQIRPVMIDEVNRIVKLFGGECVFYQEDCFNRGLSIRMCSMFLEHQKERYIKKYRRKLIKRGVK